MIINSRANRNELKLLTRGRRYDEVEISAIALGARDIYGRVDTALTMERGHRRSLMLLPSHSRPENYQLLIEDSDFQLTLLNDIREELYKALEQMVQKKEARQSMRVVAAESSESSVLKKRTIETREEEDCDGSC